MTVPDSQAASSLVAWGAKPHNRSTARVDVAIQFPNSRMLVVDGLGHYHHSISVYGLPAFEARCSIS